MSSAARWWHLAKEWREGSRDLPHGLVQARLAEFSNARGGISDLTVRRADAALRFAERLVQQKRLERPELLQGVAITYMELMQRIDRFEPTKVDELLPRLREHAIADYEEREHNGPVTGAELRRIEHGLRQVARARRGGDGALLRMGAGGTRRRALELLELPTSPVGGRLVAVRSSGAFHPLVVDAVLVDTDHEGELLQGVKVFTAMADATHPRNIAYAALLGLSGSRVLDAFYLVFEEIGLADKVLGMLQGWEAAGVGVILMDLEGPSLSMELKALVRGGLDPKLARVRERIVESLAASPSPDWAGTQAPHGG